MTPTQHRSARPARAQDQSKTRSDHVLERDQLSATAQPVCPSPPRARRSHALWHYDLRVSSQRHGDLHVNRAAPLAPRPDCKGRDRQLAASRNPHQRSAPPATLRRQPRSCGMLVTSAAIVWFSIGSSPLTPAVVEHQQPVSSWMRCATRRGRDTSVVHRVGKRSRYRQAHRRASHVECVREGSARRATGSRQVRRAVQLLPFVCIR